MRSAAPTGTTSTPPPREAVSPEFRAWLLRLVDIDERDLDKVISELLNHWGEEPRQFVRRRHRELRREGLPAPAILERITEEIPARRFVAPPMSVRQVRRVLYG